MHYAMDNEDFELSKHWIRHFIIAQKLGLHATEVEAPEDVMARLRDLWMCDDTRRHEYRMLWDQVEKEIRDAP